MKIQSRTFRSFVSSTFSDLKAERDAIQEYVFPRLSELCEAHGCRFQAIDLRWGGEQKGRPDPRALPIYLGEIARCQQVMLRHNFLILLGASRSGRPAAKAWQGER